jgi:hypothetical protein
MLHNKMEPSMIKEIFMHTTPFQTPDDFTTFISESSLEQFANTLSHFSFPQLVESFLLLQTLPAIESKRKLDCLFKFVDSPSTLEILGKHFSVPHFPSFIEFLHHHPSYQNRLNDILVGLHPEVFSQALHHLQNHHLNYLKHQGLLEPLQYHLTQFVHEGESLEQQTAEKVQQFSQNLQSTNPLELTPDLLDSLIKQIDSLRNLVLDYLERASAALSIVWHTDRIDLIEKLSSVNEILQHQLTSLIGHKPFDHLPATGLYLSLGQTLSSVFDSTLKDDDSALEGLTRLSIWHLKDYWELGLLPSIHHIQQLDFDVQSDDEEERRSHQQHLFALVQQQLDRLQIGTVGALKKAYLFSKQLLLAYIRKHQHLL